MHRLLLLREKDRRVRHMYLARMNFPVIVVPTAQYHVVNGLPFQILFLLGGLLMLQGQVLLRPD